MSMKLISVNVAQAGTLVVEQSSHAYRIVTGIHKQTVPGAVLIKKLGLTGDAQVDLSVHGGLNKAVYAYPSEHYAFWAEQRRAALKRAEPLPPGAMGENLTLQGLLEQDVWVGDRLHIGTAVLEVTEPRQPCFKFNVKMGFGHAAKLMTQSGFSGFYLRVLQEGGVQAGDTVTLIPGSRELSIAKINEQRRKGRQQDLF
jgi:MOSC domain-containing protein YiiM